MPKLTTAQQHNNSTIFSGQNNASASTIADIAFSQNILQSILQLKPLMHMYINNIRHFLCIV